MPPPRNFLEPRSGSGLKEITQRRQAILLCELNKSRRTARFGRSGHLILNAARTIHGADNPYSQLLAELELFGDSLVPRCIPVMQVIQQTAALTNHHQQSTAGSMILRVLLQVLGQMIDPLRQ